MTQGEDNTVFEKKNLDDSSLCIFRNISTWLDINVILKFEMIFSSYASLNGNQHYPT